MKKQNLILIRNIFFKTFIVGLLFALFLFVMTATLWSHWAPFVFSIFQVNEKELGEIVVKSFINLRFFLIFILLVPAISLHWVIKSIKD